VNFAIEKKKERLALKPLLVTLGLSNEYKIRSSINSSAYFEKHVLFLYL